MYFKKFRVQVSLVIVILIVYLPTFLDGKVLYWGTTTLQFIPWMKFAIERITAGEFPLWNAWNGFGSPLMANYQSAIFYPLNWILIIFYKLSGITGLAYGFTWLYLLHVMLAAIGMSLFLKQLKMTELSQLLGGFMWVFSGYIISRISFISMVWSFTWISWILYAILKIRENYDRVNWRVTLLLACFVTMQLLSGHAQTSLYTLVLAGIFLIFPILKPIRKMFNSLLAFSIAILIALGLAAIQLIPTLEYLLQSQRSNEIGYEYAANFSFWPWRIITLFFGNFLGNPGLNRFFGGGTFWEDQIYHGVFAVLLIVVLLISLTRLPKKEFSQRNRYLVLLAMIAVLSFLLALGKNFVLFPFLYDHTTALRLFQAPSRFLLFFSLALTIFTAFAFDYWQFRQFNIRKTGLIGAVGLAVLVAGLFSEPFMGKLAAEIRISIIYSAGLILLFCVMTILKSLAVRQNEHWVSISFLIVFMIDLLLINFPYGQFIHSDYFKANQTFNPEVERNQLFYLDQDAEEFLKFNRYFRFDRFQLLDDPENMFPKYVPNTNLLGENIRYVNNFDPFVPRYFDQFMKWLKTLNKAERNTILQFFGVSTILELDTDSETGLQAIDFKPLEIVQWYSCEVEIPSDETLPAILYNISTNPEKRCIFLIGDAFNTNVNHQFTTNLNGITSIFYKDGYWRINYDSSQEGWLEIRQTWYPGWKAQLENGQKLAIERTDFLFQGIKLPPGSHTLEVKYEPISFKLGWVITITTILLIIIFLATNKFSIRIRKRYEKGLYE